MHIFVTGGAGYIGSICVEQLLDAGYRVTVFDNLTEGRSAAVDDRAHFIRGDLADRPALHAAVAKDKPDAAMHFAASALVGESMTNPSKYFLNNVANGVNLLDALVNAGVMKVIFSSTCATYGIPASVPLHEGLPQTPINPYGQSKLMFEQVLNWYSQIYGLVHVNMRYFNVAGASEKFGEDHRVETHLIPNVLKVALGQKAHVEVFGDNYPTPDGTCIRDYIHAIDLAGAHILALTLETSTSYNLGNGEGYSVGQVLETCREVTGHAIPCVVREPRAGDPPRLTASSMKIVRELGWRPRFPELRQMIESAWTWHQKHPYGYEGPTAAK